MEKRMAHLNLGDHHEADGREPSASPIICESCLNPCVRRTRAGVDYYESMPRTTPVDEWNHLRRPFVCAFYRKGRCTLGARCRFLHEMPSQDMDTTQGSSTVLAEAIAQASIGTLEPPEDKSNKRLLLRGLDPTILEHDIRDQFGAYGEIESVRLLAKEACAFVTYTSREGAEKATQELSQWTTIKGHRVKLSWAVSQVHQPCSDLLYPLRIGAASSSYQMPSPQPYQNEY